ncbi:uncharacterized protein [Ptychodera flava]|uniref:uncharacterized protein n=1 Tax=Ptychodera flava TaxID=63121 RepID=UPI003969E04D
MHPLPSSWYSMGGAIYHMFFPNFKAEPQVQLQCLIYYSTIGVETNMYSPVVTLFPKGCPPDRFGGKCENTCHCQNGASCHSFNGDCLCAKGWSGVNCTDVTPTIEIQQHPEIVFVNDTLSLRCDVYGVTVESMSWSVGGVTLAQKTNNLPRTLERSTLRFVTGGVFNDGGETYTCEVVDDVGDVLSRSITVPVTGRQRIDVSPKNTVAPSGSDVLLHCSVRDRVGNLTWFMANDVLVAVTGTSVEKPSHVADGRYSLRGEVSDGEYDLRISKVQIEDAGLYYCEIGPTEYQDGVKSETAQVMIIEQPSAVQIVNWADTFHNRSLTDSEPISFMCIAWDANPPVQILWYMDGRQIRENVRAEIESSSRRGLYNTKSRITITPTYHNAGSNLSCEARSDALEYTNTDVIQLKNIRYKPVVIIMVRPQHPIEGDDVSVTCHVHANPKSTDVNFACGDNKEVHVKDGWQELELRFKNVKTEPKNIECTCTAYNELGSGRTSTNVHVSPDNRKRSLRVILCTIVPVAILLVILPPVTFKYRREIRIVLHRLCSRWTSIDGGDWKYDAFVCYRSESGGSSPEESFVIREMLPRLENDHGFRLCVHSRDFQVGAAIMDNILDAIQNSSRTILVLSPWFVQSEWCRFEYEKAQAEMLRIGTKIIPIMFEDITRLDDVDPSLKSLLNVVTYLKWPGEAGTREETEKFWGTLVEAMPKKTRRGDIDDEAERLLIA